MKKNILLFITCLVISTLGFSQVTYYVNGSDSSASNNNSGTSPGSAWRTIKKAGQIAVAGDTIIVMPGIYHETICPNNSGDTINGYITFRSEIPLAAHINGYTPLDSAAKVGSSWEIDTIWHQYNDTLTNVWKRKLKSGNFCEAYKDSVRMPSYLEQFFNPNHFHAGMSYVLDTALYVFLEDSISGLPANPSMFTWNISRNSGAWLYSLSYIKIIDFLIDSFGNEGINIGNSHHIEISGNKCAYNGRTGIAVNNNNGNIHINNNEACYNGSGLGWSSGISVFKPQSQTILVENNSSHNNCDSSKFLSDGNGFILDGSSSEGRDGGCIFKNNLSYFNQGTGIRIYRSANCSVINNTCYKNNCDELGISDLKDTILSNDTVGTHNVRVENNILFSKSDKNPLYLYLTKYNYGDVKSDYNIYLRGSSITNPPIFIDTLGSLGNYGFKTLSFFQNLTQLDSNSINTDPLLDTILHLTSLSPCIDAGNPDLDNDGQTWLTDTDDQDPDNSRMDIGAYYYPQQITFIAKVKDNSMTTFFYPNPFIKTTTLEIIPQGERKIQDYKLKIVDLFGKIVFQSEINNLQSEIHLDLSSGIYFYSLEDKKQIIGNGKIIIQ